MIAEEIRQTTKYEGDFGSKVNAVSTSEDFWLREIAAQLAEMNVYLQHQAVAESAVAAQLEALESTIRILGVQLQEKDGGHKARTPVTEKSKR